MAENRVLMAHIGAPHGVKGEVRVKSFTEDPLGLVDYSPLTDRDGRVFEIIEARPSKSVLVVRFKDIGTREKAEALNGVDLFVDRNALPETEDEDEFYFEDLIGIKVVDASGETMGSVLAIHDFGAGTILEIRLQTGKSEMFAFTKSAFPQIDLETGVIVFQPPESVSERD